MTSRLEMGGSRLQVTLVRDSFLLCFLQILRPLSTCCVEYVSTVA